MERIYLDNNATTMVDPRVRDLMDIFSVQFYGNPNSLHSFASDTHPYMREALDRLYTNLNVNDDDDIIINGCATEGNNTVLKSVYFDLIAKSQKKQIITTQIEHPSISHTAEFLESLGAEVVYLPVNEQGIVSVADLKAIIDPDKTALVSVMWANNETGLINPIKEIATLCRENGVLFHTDAVQAVGKVKIDISDIDLDYLTFSAHKFHGPKGVGGLYIKNGAPLIPLLHGGEQMGSKRSGTVNVAGMVGMAYALELAVEALEFEDSKVRRLRDKLEDAILAIPSTNVIGDRAYRTPNTILASFKGVEGEAMLWDLNRNGVAASTGSACSSESLESNPTFKAMKIDPELAHTGIRFSLSRFTTEEEIDFTIDIIKKSVERLRAISTSEF
ncbi:MAG: NifS family cysteine desulfurase [Spirochaetales bacterium]|nr:NifS family cysteine desulfurase [Spirochaetales bacterium]